MGVGGQLGTYRETMRNRERRKLGNPGVEEVGGWVVVGGRGGDWWRWRRGRQLWEKKEGRKGWQRDGNNETPY